MGLVVETYRVGYLRDINLPLFDESCRLFQSEVTYKFSGRNTSNLLQLTVELCTADTDLLGKFLYIEVGSARWVLIYFITRSIRASLLPFT